MNWFKKFLKFFVVIFAFIWVLSAIITVVIAPAVACAFGLIYAACQSGSTLYLFISMWVLPTIMAIIFGVYAVKYHEMKQEIEAMKKNLAEEQDADR